MADGTLFSAYFLNEGIREEAAYTALTDERLAEVRAELVRPFEGFRVGTTQNEAQTEQDLIFRVLNTLGFPNDLRLPQEGIGNVRRTDVPDLLLFEDAAAKSERGGEPYARGLVVMENKRWERRLDRRPTAKLPKDEDKETPSTQMLRYLSRADVRSDGRLRWGVLTNGRTWRLYFQGAKSRSEEFLSLDLPLILGLEAFDTDAPLLNDLTNGTEEDQETARDHWLRVFVLMFERGAFVPSRVGDRSFHDHALDEGRAWEAKLAESLDDRVFETAFPTAVSALYAADPMSEKASPDVVRSAALTVLYRLLFLLYAEDRDLLPRRDKRYDDYALSGLRDVIAKRVDEEDAFASRAGPLWHRFRSLCRIIDEGDDALSMPPYNGGLFARDRDDAARLLERVEVPDLAFSKILDAMARRGGKRINFRDLDVQRLGSIYERLLEFRVVIADGEAKASRDGGARSDSASFYTPEALVRLILVRTVAPLIEEARATFAASGGAGDLDPAERILALRVVDPAMGSGHFLVSLIDMLADSALQAVADAGELAGDADYVSPLTARLDAMRETIEAEAKAGGWRLPDDALDDKRLVRRMVLKRCVFGVDLNPMAVELAKLALWLHTFTAGAPLSFLDHHLAVGNSLLGLTVREATEALDERGDLVSRMASPLEGAARGMERVERAADADIAQVHRSAAEYRAVEEETEGLRAVLDLLMAERIMGVERDAPKRRPADLSGVVEKDLKKTRDKWVAYERAQAWGNVLDRTYGPVADLMLGTASPMTETGEPPAPPAPSMFDDEEMAPPPGEAEQGSLVSEDAYGTEPRRVAEGLIEEARAVANDHRFLHWQAAFPSVWSNWQSAAPRGGFDAVVGNPPYVRQEALGAIKPALDAAFDAYAGTADLYVYFYERALDLLRPGGRMALVVTNKWMRAGYAANLRRVLSEAWVETVADFGHAKQFFPDADVFPCVVSVRRPVPGEEPPETVRAADIARETAEPDRLVAQVDAESFPMIRTRLDETPWRLLPPDVQALLDKLRERGTPLAEYAGVSPLYGIKTGFNEAFLIDRAKRDELVAADPRAAEVIKPYLRGGDVERWYSPPTDEFMIVMRSSGDYAWPWADAATESDAEAKFEAAFPSLYAHFKAFESFENDKGKRVGLRHRQDSGRYWWELRPCAYYNQFEKPKIVYRDLAWWPSFSKDAEGRFANDLAFFVPSSEDWLAVGLNSPVTWYFLWRHVVHGKDDVLRLKSDKMVSVPVPAPPSELDEVSAHVGSLTNILCTRAANAVDLRTWLRHAHDLNKPPMKLRQPFALSEAAFLDALGAALPKSQSLGPKALREAKDAYAETVAPAKDGLAEEARIERRLSDLVNDAYGLTDEEVALMWRTAPPRMPVPPPASAADETDEAAAA